MNTRLPGGPSVHVLEDDRPAWAVRPSSIAHEGGRSSPPTRAAQDPLRFLLGRVEGDPNMLVELGVPPERCLVEVARLLKPGGHFLIYDLCPASKPERYLHCAYGESPFTPEQFAAAGPELVAFDVDDNTSGAAEGT